MPDARRIAIASSYGLPGDALARAYDAGVRTYFWGALRHADFGVGLRALARRDPARVVVATVSYARSPLAVRLSVDLARRRLNLDRLGLLVLGYTSSPSQRLIDAAFALRDRGVVATIGVSSHSRSLLAALGADPRFDALMVRYSAAHPNAASEVFPCMGTKQLLTYTATRWGTLLDPTRVPPGERVPSATDCYRFVLSHPRVDLCLAGPSDASELSAALSAGTLGPLGVEETAWMLEVGANVRALAVREPSRRSLLRRAKASLRSLLTRGVTEDVLSRLNR